MSNQKHASAPLIKVPKRKSSSKKQARSFPASGPMPPPLFEETRASTHNLYKQCLTLQKEKQQRHNNRLILESRVHMLKEELQKQFRNKARKNRKEEALEILYKEKRETRKSIEKIKKQRGKESEQKRIQFQRRRSSDAARLKHRKEQSLEKKKLLADNARYESRVRESSAIKQHEKEQRRRSSMRNEVRNSLSFGSDDKSKQADLMMNGLASQYKERAKSEAANIQKEEKMTDKLKGEVAVLSGMIREMQTKGRISGGFDINELVAV